MIQYIFILITFINFNLCNAWDGYNWEKGSNIEIEKGNLVRTGLDIEIYHWDTSEYRNEEVLSISNGELETYDYDTGEYNIYDMD